MNQKFVYTDSDYNQIPLRKDFEFKKNYMVKKNCSFGRV